MILDHKEIEQIKQTKSHLDARFQHKLSYLQSKINDLQLENNVYTLKLKDKDTQIRGQCIRQKEITKTILEFRKLRKAEAKNARIMSIMQGAVIPQQQKAI